MINKRLTSFGLTAFCVLLSIVMANAQTFPGNNISTAGTNVIPSAGTGGCTVAPQTTGGTIFQNAVAGVGANAALASVQINLTHTFDSDLDIYLQSPSGQIIELSTDNGGAGDNYTNTVFCDNATNNITAGAPPFTGTFRPEGTLTASACGTTITPTVTTLAGFTAGTHNGTWNLIIKDDIGGDVGTVIAWSLSFSVPGCTYVGVSLPVLNIAGTDPAVCGASNVMVTVPSGGPNCAGAVVAIFVDGVFVINSTPGAVANIGSLSSGTHTITYQLSACDFATQTINITDGVKPAITCPANQFYNLDPGACSQVVNYDVTATDNCPFYSAGGVRQFPLVLLPHGGGAITVAGNNVQGGNFFNLTNTGATPIRVTGYRVRFGTFTFGNVASPQTVNTYVSNGNTWVGQTANAGAWSSTGVASVTVAGANSELSQVDLTTPYFLNPGETKGVYLFGVNASLVYNAAAGFMANIAQPPVTLGSGASSTGLFGGIINNRTPNVEVQYSIPGPIPVVRTAGLPSGSEFPIGTTTNCFIATDQAGNTSTCCFTVTVVEFPNPITSLVCNDLVYVSLDQSCSFCLGADGVLEGGPYGCYDDYIVEVDKTLPYGNGPWLPACFGPADIGKTYQVRVTDPTTGNKCWGNVKIEDKLAPVLVCRDYNVPCNTPSPYPAPGTFNPEPAPAITGYQVQTQLPNNPIGEPGAPNPDVQVYNFDYSYLPVGTPTLDVNVRIKLTGHTFLPDLNIVVTNPQGTVADVFTLTGCTGAEWPIDVLWDDEGMGGLTLCVQLNAGGAPLQSLVAPGVSNGNVLSVLDNQNASGVWTVTISDNFLLDDGVVEIVGLEILVNLPAITTADGCCLADLKYIDSEEVGGCVQGYSRVIHRKWTATDCSGNTSTCIQDITFDLPTLGDVTLPPDYDGIDAPFFACTDNAYPTPDWIEGIGLQGYPWAFGRPDGCTINWNYTDLLIEVCDGTYKISRTWTVIDWCIGQQITHAQIIKVVDETGPSFSCPANLTVSVDPFQCCATINLPDVIITDNCSRINSLSGMIQIFDPFTGVQTGMIPVGGSLQDFPGNNWWNLDTLGNFGTPGCIPIGSHVVTYIVKDDCGNTSSCTFRLTVRDYVPPVAACDETTTIAIGIDDPFDCYGPAGPNDLPEALDACEFAGVTWVKATTFDDGSYDNCNNVKFTIRRMAPYSDCILGLNTTNGFLPCNDIFPDFPSEFERAISEYDSIKFYCCEVGTIQTIILRVYQIDVIGNIAIGPDGSPIFNECMIQVEVQDKLKPACLPPGPVTVNCENFDPSLWAYGKAQVADNCCLDTSKVYQGQCGLTHTVNYSLFDTVCNKGTITRTFRAFDCHGFSSQCTQRVFVTYEQDYFIKFPNDAIVTVCDGSGVYGEPTFFGEDCELLGVSYEDVVYTVVPDACFKIERTWTIINWCTYNPNLPCIDVPNPNPNPITNNAANLPGPTVSACGTLPPWAPTVVRINPTDPQPTNFCTFWDKDANCYRYKQIIKIIDGVKPTGTYVVPDCTNQNWLTPNHAQLWNEMYWWNNGLQLHDLCEEPTDLCITGTDACSGSNINIEYLLFLDLDGDGIMETVVNSTTLGLAGLGWNNVLYNNLNTPNFNGGTPRQFDERPVPFNQKWGFSIQETISGNTKTACVRWNTQQQQNTHVVPELPHGTHKIKWFITDGCGNNAEYEYTFTVKDCKAPTVVCLNGLSVNIMPTGMITLWASDFLQYTEDNCTPAGQLKIGIRKCGQGTGFPLDGNGNPITNVNFLCTELGTQCVELWSIDAAGNADYCETYVIVQDNLGNCPSANHINVAGALKTEDADGVEEGEVHIDGSVNFAPPFSYFDLSDATGGYAVTNNVPVAATFVIAPEKDDNPLNGVTTYDLVLISKHILGIEPLNTPYKMIAADANKSGSITTFDIVEIRKLILGIYTDLPNNTSWRFVDKAFVFPNMNNPFQTAFPETISIADAMMSQVDEDFAGVKIGDVNGTAVANATMQAEERTAGTAIFDLEDRNVKAGEEFEVSFKSAQALKGFQFTATLNGLKAIGTVNAENVTEGNFNLAAENAMAVSIDGAQEFTVRFRAEKSGKLSEMLGVSGAITRAEAYGDAGRLGVAFRFDGKTIAGVGFELYQNQPNPFVNRTFIGFFLPEAAEATLSVYDETGRVVYQQKGQFAKGENSIALDRALINTTGMLYYKLETSTDSATKKMIQAK
ncbi:MAG: HYR domain-containing protein [Saprospiraceae bacterium]|nr:HYR domain-containing protein [Saprospiraceae bacterium]